MAGGAGDFTYALVLLLWPAQPLAAMEISMGLVMASVVAVVANCFLFSIVGLVAGFFRNRPVIFLMVYVIVCITLACLALWAFGLPLSHTDAYALITAILFYGLVFFITYRVSYKRLSA